MSTTGTRTRPAARRWRRTALGLAAVLTAVLSLVLPSWTAEAVDSTTWVQRNLAGLSYLPTSGIDGAYGPHGIAGPRTYAKIYALQDNDCTPIHFAYSEFSSHDGAGFSGGKVSAAKVKSNVLRTMWKAEAVRHKLGDHLLTVISGFRSIAHNRAVGGATNSQHLYGTAVDLRGSGVTLCAIARAARTSGFSGILGPGAEGHSDHTHAGSRLENNDDGITNGFYWNAPVCF
jgi:hypothetical protein